jgi:hypothetical protein
VSEFDDTGALGYQQEVAENEERDNELERLHPARFDAAAQAAGERTGEHLDDYVPASGLWYGADVIAKASRKGGSHPPAAPMNAAGESSSADKEAA